MPESVNSELGECDISNSFAFQFKASALHELLSFGIGVLNVPALWIECEGRLIVFADVLKVYILLKFTQSTDVVLVQGVLAHKLRDELDVQLDHLEIYQF